MTVQIGFGSITQQPSQAADTSTSQQASPHDAAANHKERILTPSDAGVYKQPYPLQPDVAVQQQSYPLPADRASFPGSSEAGWQAFKPGLAGRDLKSAESLPILQVSAP